MLLKQTRKTSIGMLLLMSIQFYLHSVDTFCVNSIAVEVFISLGDNVGRFCYNGISIAFY